MDEQIQELIASYRAGRIERRDFLKWAALVGLSVPLLDTPPARAATIRRGGTLRIGTTAPASIEPFQLSDAAGIGVVQTCCEYLVRVDAHLIARPVLATGWRPSQGGRVWTFFLRRGVRFHNGALMTADDVVATFKRLSNPTSGSNATSSLAGLTPAGVRKVDQFTVAFHLARPVVDFPYYLNAYQAVILPASYQPGHFAQHAVGTGPFKLVEYVPKQRARYVRNPNYWDKGLPYLDGVEIVLGLTPQGQTTALLGNNIDMVIDTQTNTLDAVRGNPAIQVLSAPTSGYYGIFMHCDKGVFADKRVRQAMALSMNRPNVIKAVTHGLADVGNDHVVAPVFPLYSPIPQREQNYAAAKKLLAAAKHPTGFSASITTANDYPELEPLAVVVQAMLQPAGINITLKDEPTSAYYGTTNDWLNIPLTVTNWTHRPTPSQLLNIAYRTGAVWNASKWSHHTFDTLLNELDATLDLQKRKAITKQIEIIMHEEVPAIINYFSRAPRAMSTKVGGVDADPSTFLYLSGAYLKA